MIQLPGSFGPDDLPVLAAFLDAVPASFAWSVEVRTSRSMPGDAERPLNDLLHQRAVDRVVLDSRPVFDGPREDAGRDRCLGEEAASPGACRRNGEQPIVRFIGQTDADANPPYWTKWVDTVVRWLDQGRRPIVFLHTPDNLVSLELCRRFHAEVVDQSDEPNLPPAPPVSTQDGLELG